MYLKDPHTAIFSGPTSCGKTQKMLDLIEQEYKGHFENIVILCPTLQWNKTYLDRSWVWSDKYVFLVVPNGNLFPMFKKLSTLFSGEETLFILDDCISEKELDKTRGFLLNLAISGRHRKYSLWLLTQRYNKILISIRDQLKQLFVWYPKNSKELKLIHEENHIIDDDEDLKMIRE